MPYVSRMWENLSVGSTFDVTLVLTSDIQQRELLRGHFERAHGWNRVFHHSPVHFASLDEMGRAWRGGNFDASLVGIQRARRLLRKQGIADEAGRCLVVLAAGRGTRAYPLTAAERGNKSMIWTPAQMNHRTLRLIELVIAEYHQILDQVEPGRIHVAAGDHLLAWDRPPKASGRQHLQVSASTVSFLKEAQQAGLLDGSGRPRWSDPEDLEGRLAHLRIANDLPVLHSLTQFGLIRATGGKENLACLMEKAGVSAILQHFANPAGEARVNWWDWSVSPDAAHLLLTHYAHLLGTGIDFSIDVLEPLTLTKEEWRRRWPLRDPALWDRANLLFESSTRSGTRPLGRIGVADPGRHSVFADLGTLRGLHQAYTKTLENTEEGIRRRRLLGVELEEGVLFAGERPGPGVEVEPGSVVIDGAGIRSGFIGAGSVVVDAEAGDLRTSGRCIVYGIRAPRGVFEVTDGGVAAGVVERSRRPTVRGNLLGSASPGGRSRPGAARRTGSPAPAPSRGMEPPAAESADSGRPVVRPPRRPRPGQSRSPWRQPAREDRPSP